jgi:hypothetical protein
MLMNKHGGSAIAPVQCRQEHSGQCRMHPGTVIGSYIGKPVAAYCSTNRIIIVQLNLNINCICNT